ncbi:MAG: DNA repair protein RadA [Bacteroidia bacterium]|nr:DNA repair protein RadA [Bacteroidia bacterium]MCZ2278419.1 DNA repair protein RadA [Bacteroidia bacterium]
MAKVKTIFICQNCGIQSSKWIGKCPSCNEWNTFTEELLVTEEKLSSRGKKFRASAPVKITSIEAGKEQRLQMPDKELNRVLGGGLVLGSLILIGGEPGIGKSTLLLQTALRLKDTSVLYISGEESQQQIKLRADRIGIHNSECMVLTEVTLELIFKHLETVNPDIIIVDSVQTLYSEKIESAPGSVSQIRECAAALMRYAKDSGTAILLIGHITKEGVIAGPKILEHMVDTVLQFEGDRNYLFRLLRSSKNRFGSTAEIGIYEMHDNGLSEVLNPSEILLPEREEFLSGVATACTMDGLRPMLIEAQALVSSAVYGIPQRSSTGFDTRRMNMLLAVLEKRCGFMLGAKDVFLNITGGLRVDDPATDLAISCAILSSDQDIAIHPKTCFAAEVGLSGEIRPVNRIEQRINEAEKLGFKHIYFSKYNQPSTAKIKAAKIKLHPISKIEDVFSGLFG